MSTAGVMNEQERRARLAALYAKRPQVIKPGLERMLRAAAEIGRQEPGSLAGRVPCVLIAGTNGKGSTTGFLWQLFTACGVDTGIYTSPHLVDFAERIQVSGRRVSIDDVLDELERLRQLLPTELYEALSFFELTSLAAMRIFSSRKTTLNLYEVGLGGRWDATNVAGQGHEFGGYGGEPLAAVITSIGVDHTEFLGSDTAQIATEKAGVMRAGRPVFWGGLLAADTASDAVIRREAEAMGAPLIELEPSPYPLPRRLAQAPRYLQRNFNLALQVFAWIVAEHGERLGLSLTPQALIEHALAAVDAGLVPRPPSLAGRFERLELATQTELAEGCAPRPVLLDVCHNVHGAEAFVRGLTETGLLSDGPLPGLVSILADKKCDEILDVLRPALSPLVLYPVATERSWTRHQLAERHQDLVWEASLDAGWARMRREVLGSTSRQPLVLCGSVFGIGEVLRFFGLEPFAN